MLRYLHTLHLYVRTRRAEVRRRSGLTHLTSQELNFQRYWKILVQTNRLGVLTVKHDARIRPRPIRSTFKLRADESVFDNEFVRPESFFVEEMPKRVFKPLSYIVSIVPNR